MRRGVAVLAIVWLVAACASDGSGTNTAVTTTTSGSTTTVLRYVTPIFDDIEVTSDIAYGAAPGVDAKPESLTLDVYQPRRDRARDRPLVLFAHGGGFSGGDKSVGPSSELAPMFARLGYVAVSINYRLLAVGGCSGAGGGSASCQAAAVAGIHDGQAAVRFMRAHAMDYGVDPDRIAIGGESAGAIIAMGVGVWSDVPGDSGTPGVSSTVRAWMSLSGGLPGGLLVNAGDAPGLLLHGTSDPTVPYQWSSDTDAAMKKAGVVDELVTYDGAGHVPWREQRDDIVAKTIAFFRAHLV